jgi:nitrate reductase gamma subunit
MRSLQALVIVAALGGIVMVAAVVPGLRPLLGIAVPYLALAVFLLGMTARIVGWARSPVPFKITTVCGQQRSLAFLPHQRLESPFTWLQVFGRMVLEVLTFRSLFRNTESGLTTKKNLVYEPSKWLWAGALAFHWSFLVILLRHLRFFMEPIPRGILFLENLDGLLQITVPTLFMTDVIFVAAVLFLLGRRLLDARIRYFSLPADYFVLFLLLTIAGSGILIRYFEKIDVAAIKEFAMGLATFHPVVPESAGVIFYLHLVMVATLFAYFPFSKLVHLGGVFLSPTRNLANDNRARRHTNPWDRQVDVHTYEEWEEEFHDKLRAAGMLQEEGD